MANLATGADCFDYCFRRSGENENSSRFSGQLQTYLNIAQRELVSGSSMLQPSVVATFPWAKAAVAKNIVLEASVSGTVAVTNNSASITFSAGPTNSLEGYYLTLTGNATVYRISSHTAASTSATLDSVVVSSTSAAVAYTAFKIDYTVGSSDILRIVSPLQGFISNSNGDSINQVNGEEEFTFRRSFPVPSSGEPTHFAVVNELSGTFTIKFNKYPSAQRRLDVPYIPIPSDITDSAASIPLVPIHFRHVMCHLALFYLQADKNDTRSQENFQLAQLGYASMLKSIGLADFDFLPLKPNVEVKNNVQGA